ncbi:TFIIIC transcription initiation factor complex subunits Tfc3, putative [Penicillium digitatum]|uniref:TFIIIC transcription initiation factor complex subunits Tfc3, putative n=3 Tax=Penicillium digitatum TaxID=36651 RepID=K9GBY5_PEND2|nr:TFIIIC transcription initiation factor complex subunits Tfc3, putative [Penicillium digitatum Pd1]EKV16149.1 TFIIIC transcription initiation factor complex subunits Tfc3, putative [Penicillium digitatum Pd1]EKV18644.1 TFIIIC transcription initiation factor complex subunits Tfc3, putative [Penicillium digitatum PHI26]QQK42438.1 TFIIIC transcription initiation factor complex subunits Tfc3, putative [Penicillium digitatum]
MPGVQHLIDFVLNEVALCGNQGATLSDLLQAIDDFHTQTQDVTEIKQNVDHRFKAKVWSWITTNPEVSIGQHNEWNHLTLNEAEKLDSRKKKSDDPEVNQIGDQNLDLPPLRIYVSEERAWLAITGHPPDESKVLPLEFALLSVIASRKSKGIVQPDLVKLSGQDKRSVPKRTDALQRKGYIDKRPVQTKTARTSLCTLQRFYRHATGDQAKEEPQLKNMIDFDSFNTSLFDILREHQLIARNDLKRLLGFDDHWRWKVLSRALRKWERIGVVQRVRAESQYERMHPCVKLLRDPTEQDLALFHEFNFDILNKHGVRAKGNKLTPGQNQYMELDDPSKRSPSPEDGRMDMIKEQIGDSARIVPSWTPDRNLNNQIFDVIERTGTTGITNQTLNWTCFGSFYKRSAESMVHRLVDLWQVAQPLHLRHYAIVRDMAMKKTIMFYVHYSANNFAKLVEAGQASWEAVEIPAKKAKSLKIVAPSFGVLPELDEYGFLMKAFPKNMLKDPNSTLLDGIMAVKPPNYLLSSSDPFVVELPNGQHVIRTRADKLPPGSKQQYEPRFRPKGRPKGRLNRATLEKRARESKTRETKAKEAAVTESEASVSEPRQSQAMESQIETKQEPSQGHVWEYVEEFPRAKRAKIKHDNLKGLSKQEKFEALGMDESWTEYKALVMDKPAPGVYVTPHGRRRPAGKARGRPRQSRIAIFKSPNLVSMPWFVKDKDDSSDDDKVWDATASTRASESVAPESAHPVINSEGPAMTPTPTTLRGVKRILPDQPEDLPTPSPSFKANEMKRGRPPKRSRLQKAQDGSIEGLLKDADEIPPEDVIPVPQERSIKAMTPRHRDKSASVHLLEDDKAGTPLKRLRVTSSDCTSNDPTTLQSPTPRPSDVLTPRSGSVGPQKFNFSAHGTKHAKKQRVRNRINIRSLRVPEDGESGSPKPSIGRGGSISVLRRKLIMEIMEKADGVYPAGTAMWYPFVTAWMKFHPNEKPDMRTINTACKQLIDAGQLRQLTFSGRDTRQVMVTRTLLLKPEVSPDDPLVKEMQSKVLAADFHESRPFFAANVEVDPNLTRNSGRPHGAPPRAQRFSFPVEEGAHVHLQQKPISIVNLEARRRRQAQANFIKRLEAQAKAAKAAEEEDELPDLPGVQRLMTLARPPELDLDAHPHTSIIRPYVRTGTRGPGKHPKSIIHPKQMIKPISAIGAYAMLMSPTQQFDSATGTFSTGSCSKRRRGRPMGARPPVSNIDESVDELSRLAHDEPDLPEMPKAVKNKVLLSRFNQKTKRILKWELHNPIVFESKIGGQQFIRQTIQDGFKPAPITGDIRFDMDMPPSPLKQLQVEQELPARRSDVRRQRPSLPQPPPTPTPNDETSKRTPKPRRTRAPRVPRAPVTDRRLAKLDDTATADKETQSTAPKRIRRQRFVRPISEDLKQKLVVALVVVRVLAGGAESRVIDWALLTKAFPDQDSSFIEARARQILNKNRLQITKMHRDFQECFLEAYEKDEVPRIDYSDLDGYDWPALVEWASTRLNVSPSEQAPDLPATREQFNSVFELREDALTAGDELYQAVHGVTINHKRNLMARNPFAVPVDDETRTQPASRKAAAAQLEAAKTWVRANIVTAEETYRPNESSDILQRFGDRLITTATQTLINERVISSTTRGRVTPGRNYDISEYFLQTLSRKRAVESIQLRRAARFKTNMLDLQFRTTGSSDVDYTAEDGDILALINLYASGAIQMRPRDAPRAKFGLTDGGYETRQMDKKRFRFPIEITPTAAYSYGNPVHGKAAATILPPAPSSSDTKMPPRNPLWYDINGEFVRSLWDLVVGPVLGCLVMRPGLKAGSISNMIKPTMGTWETVLMLHWLEEVGIVKSYGEGEMACWRLQESWWMILS